MPQLQAAQIPVTPFQQNCALIWDAETRRGTVIDPGGDVPRILAALDKAGFGVDRILLTHGHLDHAGGAAALKRALEARQGEAVPIEGPDRRDAFLLEGLADQGASFGIEGLEKVSPDRWLVEGETVAIAGQEFAVLHCPGHTPGHVAFVSTSLKVAVVGDVIFRGSVGRTDFPYGDPVALIAAIKDKLLPLGDDIRFLCGHGPGSTLGEERRSNPFLAGRG
ncbi:MBL fold metallo-hydrolase [Roseomonas sp. M0104]|uniref:MBL fold metallo-hydrolase n=1 Tax=Teichococcus coralli TaxID=2545983 RepID=A0A845B646_9PROT|nr:MBL fold metallo-hydrolase [Pseudoroseomonas coralli]MXP62125.1 MBL fold metallo-hydrolase [Pseudoroseomonas coralli]